MRVIDVLEALKYGELANSHLSDSLLENTADKAIVYSYINRALAELNSEFFLNQEELIIDLIENKVSYFVTGSNVIKIITAYNSSGVELSINNENNSEYSIFTPTLNTVEYYGENKATSTVDDYLSLIYLKEFDKVTEDLSTVPIPESYFSALLNYVGYLAQHSLGIANDNTAGTLKAGYMESLNRIRNLGFNQDDNKVLTRFSDKGFV